MSKPSDDLRVRRVMALGRLGAWQAVQVRKMQRAAADASDGAPPAVPDEPTPRLGRRLPPPSLVGLLGMGLTLWCAWLLTTGGTATAMQQVQAWGGMVGGLVLVGASFWLQKRLR